MDNYRYCIKDNALMPKPWKPSRKAVEAAMRVWFGDDWYTWKPTNFRRALIAADKVRQAEKAER